MNTQTTAPELDKNKAEVQTLAERALMLEATLAPLRIELERVKDNLRYYAQGETIIVPGQGKVIVGHPVVGSPKLTLEVNEKQFRSLPQLERQRLINQGLVLEVMKPGREAVATIKIVLNV